jgi:hypothetical protein
MDLEAQLADVELQCRVLIVHVKADYSDAF